MAPFGKKTVSCPAETTLRVIGGKRKVLAPHAWLKARSASARFSGISQRTLPKQLGELEAEGITNRERGVSLVHV